jgi:hypothetical protein
MIGVGLIPVQVPCVRDHGPLLEKVRFTSSIQPPSPTLGRSSPHHGNDDFFPFVPV